MTEQIAVGQVFVDNDPRSAGRTVTVLSVDERWAYCKGVTRVRIDKRRMYLDGRSRRTGFSLLGKS